MKKITEQHPAFKAALDKLVDLEARQRGLEQREQALVTSINDAMIGLGPADRRQLLERLLENPSAELPGGIDLDARQRALQQVRTEKKLVAEAGRAQRDQVEPLRTTLTQKMLGEISRERGKRLLVYLESALAVRQAFAEVVDLRNQLEASDYRATMFEVPFYVLRSVDSLVDELLRDSSISGDDRSKIERLRESAVRQTERERERVTARGEQTLIMAQCEAMQLEALSNLQRR